MKRRANREGSVLDRGTSWQLRVTVHGRRHHRSLPKDAYTEGQALRECSKWATELENQLPDWGTASADTMAELLGWFERGALLDRSEGTQRTYRDSIKVFRAYWKGGRAKMDPRKMRPSDVKAFLRWRRHNGPTGPSSTPISDRTRSKDRTVLGTIFREAVDEGLLKASPVTRKTRVEKPKRGAAAFFTKDEYRLLTDEEYDEVLRLAAEDHPMFGLYLLLLGETGARAKKEALNLQWGDVDLADGFIRFRETKSGEPRYTPMTRRLVEGMREHFARFRFAQYRGRPSPWVFHHIEGYRCGSAEYGDRIVSAFRTRWERVRRLVGVEGTRLHDLRHRRVTNWIAEGQGAELVGEAVGHADPKVTAHYTHLTKEHLRKLVEPLEDAKLG